MQFPTSRRLLRPVAAALVIVAGSVSAHAAPDTELKDASGVLTVSAEGRWREQTSEFAISATGFLGVKRAEFFATVYADEKAAAGAAKRWKAWRTEAGDDPTYTHEGQDALRFTAQSSAAGTVDYVRALDGARQSAVVWVRLSGEPGVAATEATKLLDGAKMGAPAKADATAPAGAGTGSGGTTAGAGGTGAGEAPTAGADAAAGERVVKDPDFRVQLVLPPEFELRKDLVSDGRRVLSAIGTIGSDTEAYFDLFLFDDYLRADAAGLAWMEKERVGWRQGVQVSGDHGAFKLEVRDETWTRHVRVVPTEAGVIGIKIDAASQVDAAAVAALDAAIGSLKVLKPRLAVPVAPPGMKTLAGDLSVLQYELAEGAPASPDDFLHESDVVEEHVQELLGGITPRDGLKSVLRVYPSAKELANALRPVGVTDGRNAFWWMRDGVVLTHADALSNEDARAELRSELSRFSMQRRFGFRAPFWLEAGGAKLIASSAYNKGRIDLLHPLIVGLVRDVAPNGMEHETVRWWPHDDAAEHSERGAVAWSFLYFFLYGGQSGVKWKDSYVEYVKLIASTGDPVEAGKAFDFSRNVELAEDWKKWARRL